MARETVKGSIDLVGHQMKKITLNLSARTGLTFPGLGGSEPVIM